MKSLRKEIYMNMKKFISLIITAVLLIQTCSAMACYEEASQNVSLDEVIAAGGVNIKTTDIINIRTCLSNDNVRDSEQKAYIEILSSNEQGTTKTLIIPYTITSDGCEVSEICSSDEAKTTRGSSGYVPVSFRNINIVVTVMASYNGTPSSGIYPVGITSKWNLIDSDGAQNVVSSLKADYYVCGALVNMNDPDVIIDDDYQYHCQLDKSSPVSNVYYSNTQYLSNPNYRLVLNGSPLYGQNVLVTIMINNGVTSFSDGFPM